MGVCLPRPDDGREHGRSGYDCLVLQQLSRKDASRWREAAEPLGTARHARQRLGVGRGRLSRKLQRSAHGRERLDSWRRPEVQGHARRLLDRQRLLLSSGRAHTRHPRHPTAQLWPTHCSHTPTIAFYEPARFPRPTTAIGYGRGAPPS